MTCVAALVDDGHIYIGADSAGVDANLDLRVRADSKLWVDEPFVFGFCGSFRMGQLLRHHFNPPRRQADKELDEFMCVDFIDAVRLCLSDGGYMRVKDEVEEGGNFIVGYESRLFEIEGDFQVAEYFEPYAAIGCGFPYALAVLEVTKGPPRRRITRALEVAEKYSAGVRSPFSIVKLEAGGSP